MGRLHVFGPMRMAEAFLGHLARSEQRKRVTLTSIVGSMARNTAAGSPRAEIDAVTCVSRLRKVTAALTPAHAGRFLSYAGEELPW